MKLPEGKSRLDLVKSGLTGGLPKRGRFVVSIERLMEDPDNERKTFRNMDDLVDSVRRHGIIEPITVTPEGEGYRILTGHRRFRAARVVGLTEVEVLVREPEERSTRRFKSLISNIQRENIGALELAETLQSLLDAKAVPTQRELAWQVGKSEQWMSGMLRILDMPASIKDKLRGPANAIGYDTLQRIAQVGDPKVQEELVQAALAGETSREIRLRIDGGKTTPNARAKQGKASVFHFTEKVGSCVATVKARREAGAREAMLQAIRKLEEQIRHDDSVC